MTTSTDVVNAAVNWWLSIRPERWSLREHLDVPAVNTNSPAEARLARAVARYVMDNGHKDVDDGVPG